jgi:hypothetical protein
MKFSRLYLLICICGIALCFAACKHKAAGGNSNASTGGNAKLVGEWHSVKDSSKLKITGKKFADGDSPEPEDYFVKGDTIYTSFEGNLPYTKYAIKKLDDHNLDLFTPDSVMVSYKK